MAILSLLFLSFKIIKVVHTNYLLTIVAHWEDDLLTIVEHWEDVSFRRRSEKIMAVAKDFLPILKI